MKISLIIPTKNREKELQHALQSVFAQTRLPDELIIIDDGNLNLGGLYTLVDQRIPLKYFKKDVPGLVKSRNKGVEMADGDIISFIDDDVELAPNYFEIIERIFEADIEKQVGGLGAYIETPQEGVARGTKNLLEKFFFIRGKRGSVLPSMHNTFVEKRPKGAIRVDWLPGCNLNFRREVFHTSGFDTFFTEYGYGEDLEFSYRIHTQGHYTLGITGQTSLKHFHTPTSRIAEKKLGYMMIANRRYMFKKLIPQTFKNRAIFAWSLVGVVILEFLSKLSNPFKNRGGRIFGMLQAVRAHKQKTA
jgi:glycosyltransferase involved in cell wall biosynthesis